ncbi:tRNA (N6-threonylcarbamoyladenosine(37)-N6)-methyltransferase TrmO [Candidatus Aerophobetes bacterium]|uniref:tRNA (N6-threonylcarbamoyladenosine(37)-N6)-methyltransferase TrmO n=1 Tax=Aerophobetes bacterium TaxID=2030807 RepID=A0A662D6C6_UNCAE|nr:MAG: tRNA (N6-threonylcarbamoyladenosine(37)-N6)-methyltransferase TrmO [Candidatus Aerophobetes bacterium]
MKLYQIGTAYRSKEEMMRIEIYPRYAKGLDGIERLKKIYVLYWMHRLNEEDRKTLRAHPRGNKASPLTGVFALRSPMRPNPIGLTCVELVKRENNNLFVKGLDALDGSPVIDIKSG